MQSELSESVPPSAPSPPAAVDSRLSQVDALRGVAALAVVLFHYSYGFVTRYAPDAHPLVWAPHGHLGVNLFFIISGFVIFMTLTRIRRSMDFVVSRFSRLFPAYWVAVGLTFAVVGIEGLPGKEVGGWQALSNLTMVHGLFGVPHVDGVYWTLEVELLFYAGMLVLHATGRLQQVHVVLWALLAARLAYFVAAQAFGIDLPWTLYRLAILRYIPWFALGICIYQQLSWPPQASRREPAITALLSLACLLIVDGWVLALIGVAFAVLVLGAAHSRLTWLDNRALAYLGTISYTLYLLHENIGWVVQRAVVARGGPIDLAMLLALAVSVVLASALTWTVEKPAMQAVRRWYRRRAPKTLPQEPPRAHGP